MTNLLLQSAVNRGEGILNDNGAFVVNTGKFTGRAADYKYIVKDTRQPNFIWRKRNKVMSPGGFDALYNRVLEHLASCDVWKTQRSSSGLDFCIITEYLWHSVFAQHLLNIGCKDKADYTILVAPTFPDTFIALDLLEKKIVITGTGYAGEIKKAVFSVLNYELPLRNILPMHCAATTGPQGTTLFYGLSSTGKTTLSSSTSQMFVGDDEHSWSDDGVENMEAGCYAKTEGICETTQPQIHKAVNTSGAIIENPTVVNARGAYPIQYLNNVYKGVAPHPTNIIMLTCAVSDEQPLVKELNPEEAIDEFLKGRTMRMPGTEFGLKGPEEVSSPCFGEPFIVFYPQMYADLLKDKLDKHKPKCWLLNTGWKQGSRIPLETTKEIVKDIIGE